MTLRHTWRALTLAILCIGFGLPAAAQTFSNTAPISVSTSTGPADLYPSTIAVSGVTDPISRVTVTLADFNHTFPDDIDVLLVGPTGASIIIMSDLGGGTDAVGVSLTFDDSAPGPLPDAALQSGTYQPTNIGAGDTFDPPAPTPGAATTFAAAFDGTDANGTWELYVRDDAGGDAGAFAGGWTLSINAVAPTLTVTPGGPENFGTAATCGVSPSVQRTFTASNTGDGTVSVNSVTVSGSSAFSVDSDAPVTLNPDESTSIAVTFAPDDSQNGAQAAVLSIAYNDGEDQTTTIDLSGTADNVTNLAVGAGEGYRFGTSDAACAGADAAAVILAPFGTAEGDTEVTLSDDEVTPSIPLGTRIRLFGQPHNNMVIGSNGFVSFGPAGPGNFPSTTTGVNGATLLHLAREDLNPGVGGQIFYGFRDVTGNAALEVIVTFYRVPFFGTTSYLTAQAIVSPSSTRGGNSTVTMQYLNGTDPADGMPYSSVSQSDASSLTVALMGDQALMQTFYATTTVDRPLFGGTETLAVGFTPRAQQIVTGDAGWRLLSHGPSAAPDTEYLVEQNFVQGLSDEYPAGDVTLFTGFDGTAYSAPATRTTDLTAGKGLFWYFFDRTQNPVTTTGISNSIALPAALTAGGAEATGDVTVALTAGLDGDGTHSEMLGNPFEVPFSASTLVFNSGDASTVALLYDPVANDFSPAPGNEVPVWGGFFVDAGTATEVTMPNPDTPMAKADEPAETRTVAFELSGARADGSRVMDRGAVLVFADAATPAWDALDAAKPAVPGARVELAVEGGRRGDAVRPRAQASFPLDGAATAELSVGAVGTEGELTLRWDRIENVPADWTMRLRDLVTGAVIDLRTESEYVFTVAASARTAADEDADAGLAPPVPTAKAAAPVRFVAEVTPSGVTPTDVSKTEVFAFEAARPNPTRGTASVRFSLPEAADVEVALYDLLGRRVATLAEGERAAGWHDVSLDASALSAGVYVLRMQTDGFAETQRVTVVR